MLSCDTVQARLGGDDAAAAGDPEIREHLQDCDDCRRFRAALTELARGIDDLPQEHAPASLIDRVAREVEQGTASARRSAGPFGAARWATAAASVLVAAALVGVIDSLPERDVTAPGWVRITGGAVSRSDGFGAPPTRAEPTAVDPVGGIDADAEQFVVRTYQAGEDEVMAATEQRAQREVHKLVLPQPSTPPAKVGEKKQLEAIAELELPMLAAAPKSDVAAASRGDLGAYAQVPAAEPADELQLFDLKNVPESSSESIAANEPLASLQRDLTVAGVAGQALAFDDDADERVSGSLSSVEIAALEEAPLARDEEAQPQQKLAKRKRQKREGADKARSSELEAEALESFADMLPAEAKAADDEVVAERTPRLTAMRFLDERETLEGLQFQPASGYWSNTYLPGDPEMRLLAARLRAWDRSTLLATLGGARLESGARPNWQPFDPPQSAALAAYLHADKAALDGESRLRIQVGLKATKRGSGHRPAVNAALVLDVRVAPSAERRAEMQALVLSLARAAQPGDRFALVAAGPGGGVLVQPDQFRHGALRVTLQRLFEGVAVPNAVPLSLPEAISMATDVVRRSDDPSAPLGASLILLATAGSHGADFSLLERRIHDNAVAGIVFSAVALGSRVEGAPIERLVLLGQGHRRALAGPDDAPQLVDRELFAAARAVARAVRLRIRLAPGVELVRVIGAERLDEGQSERVRQAERSIDRRLARNLGIEADRGEDEEGIQIVIPSLYSGDDHAVLIDVVAPGPGPVADLTIRYKDLVYLRNGVVRARLTLPAGDRRAGPLERNVLKNELTMVLSSSARKAGERLALGDRAGAARVLTIARDLVRGLRDVVPGWRTDPELLNDEAMLDEYLAALSSSVTHAANEREQLARSLRYLAYRRLLPAE